MFEEKKCLRGEISQSWALMKECKWSYLKDGFTSFHIKDGLPARPVGERLITWWWIWLQVWIRARLACDGRGVLPRFICLLLLCSSSNSHLRPVHSAFTPTLGCQTLQLHDHILLYNTLLSARFGVLVTPLTGRSELGVEHHGWTAVVTDNITAAHLNVTPGERCHELTCCNNSVLLQI